MIRSLGTAIDRTDVLVASLGSQHSFVIIQGGNLEKPLVVPYTVLLKAILASISLPAGSAAWGSILTGTGVASQTDLITYLNNNYYPLLSNPAGYVTASSLATTLLGYVTTAALASALAGYVPTSRTLTIHGVTFDLSADRSWTISGGSAAWGSIATGTGVGSQADLVAYLVANYYPLSGNPSGFITSAALTPYLTIVSAAATYVPLTRSINTEHSITGGGNLSADRTFRLVNDVASPGANRVYGTNSSGVRGWITQAEVRGLPVGMYNQEMYIAGNATVTVEYVPSTGKLYIGSNAGTVSVYDVSTGVLLATLSVTTPNKIKYIASINEVWVTSSTLARIDRISTLNTLLTPITTSVTAGGADILEYSSTKVFVLISASPGRIMVINPSTLSWVTDITTNVQPNGFGMAWNQNPSSAQNGFVVITGFNSVAILNPVTNVISTTAVNPSSSLSSPRGIVYIPSIDKYYVASMANHTIVCLDVASATTFTVNSIIRNAQQVADLSFDETIGYLFAITNISNTGASTGALGVKAIPYLAVKPNLSFQTQLIAGGIRAGYISMDLANKRFFVVGAGSAPGFCNEIKYYV